MNTNNILTQTDLAAQLQRRRALTGILEYAVTSLELTSTQRESVEKTYHECGAHLSKSLGLAQHLGDIFPQGSMRLGTVIRPLRDITDFFDIDVVFRVIAPAARTQPAVFRNAVGTHLREKYNGAVKPLAKGWRLDFGVERDYYVDVIPAMDSARGGEVIAITDDVNWKDSHPRGYAGWFEGHAKVMPVFGELALANRRLNSFNSAKIEPLPEHTDFKLPLQRITQISKRHRDYYFNKKTKQPDLTTPSIVITTLLTKAYADSVSAHVYESGYDLLLVCAEEMQKYIRIEIGADNKAHYILENPSLPTENLLAKWSDHRYAQAFYAWHKDFVAFLLQLQATDAPLRRMLSEALGEKAITGAFAKQADSLNAARQHHLLSVTPAVGLTVGVGAAMPIYPPHQG
jgi:hypothetical protein